jgi:hypothetical protein
VPESPSTHACSTHPLYSDLGRANRRRRRHAALRGCRRPLRASHRRCIGHVALPRRRPRWLFRASHRRFRLCLLLGRHRLLLRRCHHRRAGCGGAATVGGSSGETTHHSCPRSTRSSGLDAPAGTFSSSPDGTTPGSPPTTQTTHGTPHDPSTTAMKLPTISWPARISHKAPIQISPDRRASV